MRRQSMEERHENTDVSAEQRTNNDENATRKKRPMVLHKVAG